MSDHFAFVSDSLFLAKMISDKWEDVVPEGNFPVKPSVHTLSLAVDCLKHYKLLDDNQASYAVRLMRSAAKARSEGNLDLDIKKHLSTLAAAREGDDGKMFDDFLNQADALFNRALPDPVPIDPEEDLAQISDRRLFVCPKLITEATNDEAKNGGTSKPQHMSKLQGLGTKKYLVRAPEDVGDRLRLLKGAMPNFGEVIDDILVQVQAQRRIGRAIKIQPLLLVGKPGIGKTRFLKQLAAALGTESHVFNMGGSADTVKLRGVSRGWGSARPGDIAVKLAKGNTFNPILLFDEIEKATRSGHDALHDVHGLLLSYLETETNGAIEDDYLACPMDLSCVQYIFACNSVELLPSAFLSRLDVYNIPDLDDAQFLNLGRMMVVEVNHEEFDDALESAPIDVIRELVKCENARELRRAVFRAIARALAAGDKRLTLEHVQAKAGAESRPAMGFLSQ